jgi:hypothetical protein
LEDIAADALPGPQNHSLSERDQLLEDHDFTVRRYPDFATSMISECCMSDTPSMQISWLRTAESLPISTGSAYISIYETAKTHISEALALTKVIEEEEDYQDECTQISVKWPYDYTTVLHVDPGFTIENIYDLLRSKIQIHGMNVFFFLSRSDLEKMSFATPLQDSHNATIFYNIRIVRDVDIFIRINADKVSLYELTFISQFQTS